LLKLLILSAIGTKRFYSIFFEAALDFYVCPVEITLPLIALGFNVFS